MSVPAHARSAHDPKEMARTFLTLANAQYQLHRANRSICALSAREYGLTNQEIADIYGVTEAAVRAMVKRAVMP